MLFSSTDFIILVILFLSHLILRDLLVIHPPLLHLHRLPPLLLLHLSLQIIPQHLLLPVCSIDPFLLNARLVMSELLLFLADKFLHIFLFLLHLWSGLVLVDALEAVLVVHELTVVLFVDCLFLGFEGIARSYFLIKLLLIPLLLLLLPDLSRLLIRQLLLHSPPILIQLPPLPVLLSLEHPLIILQHILLILNLPPPLFFGLKLLILHYLLVFGCQS